MLMETTIVPFNFITSIPSLRHSINRWHWSSRSWGAGVWSNTNCVTGEWPFLCHLLSSRHGLCVCAPSNVLSCLKCPQVHQGEAITCYGWESTVSSTWDMHCFYTHILDIAKVNDIQLLEDCYVCKHCRLLSYAWRRRVEHGGEEKSLHDKSSWSHLLVPEFHFLLNYVNIFIKAGKWAIHFRL